MKTDTAEDLKLYLAAMESYRTGSLTPILKEELKYHIQSRRMSEGKDEMIVEFDQGVPRKQVRSFSRPKTTALTHLYLAFHKWTVANSVDPDQTPHTAASDQGLHFALITGISIKMCCDNNGN